MSPGATAPPVRRPSAAVPWRLDPGTARGALRLLREALWIRLLLAVTVLSVAFVFLGRWQLHRHEAKVARNALIDANYAAAPVPLADVLAEPARPLPTSRRWTPVEVTGVYQTGATVVIRNRPLDGSFGYEVVVPLRLASGAALLVDRGWVPPGEDFVRPATVPAPPAGQVSVVVRLRPGEPGLSQQPPPGQELRIDLRRLAADAGGVVYSGAYGVLASEHPAAASTPTPLPRPDEDLGPHLAYAVQWWLGAIAAWLLLGYYAVREACAREAAAAPGDVPAGGGGAVPGTPDPATPRPRRFAGRHRGPTDEEWEDAAS